MAQNADTIPRLRRRDQQQADKVNAAVTTVFQSSASFAPLIPGQHLMVGSILKVRAWFSVQVASSNTLTISLSLGGVTIATPVAALALSANAIVLVLADIAVTAAGTVEVNAFATPTAGNTSQSTSGLDLNGNPILAFTASLGTVNGDSVAQTILVVEA